MQDGSGGRQGAVSFLCLELVLRTLLRATEVASATLRMSLVRRRVASSDWWASRHVVSVMSRPWWRRTALAKALGPPSRYV